MDHRPMTGRDLNFSSDNAVLRGSMGSKLLRTLAASFIAFLVAFAINAQPKTGPDKSQDEVRKLERVWLDAYEKKDVQAMNAIVADDFTITFGDGSMQTKPQIIGSLRRPGGTSTKFFTENVQSRSYGDTVILIGIVVSEWMQNGEKKTDRSRYTDTYVKRNGKWQVVASHLSNATK
jgi:ketosteroid isomerase-like protein